MLGEIIVNHEGVLTVVQEILAHGAAAVRREVLQRCGVRCGGVDDDGVVHGAVLFERADHLGHGRLLLTDGYVNADDVLALLIDDRIDRDGGLAGLAVADDQLTLAAADRDHGVDRFEAGLQRLLHRLAVDDAGGKALDRVELGGVDRSLAVDGDAERIDDAADESLADRDGHDLAGALDLVAFLDGRGLAEEHDADVIFLEVESKAGDVMRELHELTSHDAIEAVDAGDTVSDGDDCADFRDVDAAADSA